MNSAITKKHFFPQEEDLDAIWSAYNQGQYLRAYNRAVDLAPLRDWRGAEGRLMAARLSSMTNNQRLAKVIFYRAWKEHPDSLATIYEYARRLRLDGLYLAYRFIRRNDTRFTATDDLRARWLALKGNISARFRNFERAHEYIQSALALEEDDPWLVCELAYILEFEDRYEESLSTIDRIFTSHPSYRPAYQQKAYLLQLIRRDDEARSCLQEAAAKFESYYIGAQLMDVLIEAREYEEALALCAKLDELMPGAEASMRSWAQGRKVDILCNIQRYDEAVVAGQSISSSFYKTVLENLLSNDAGRRKVVLPVSFIRQQHNTCGPATMSAICDFHGSEVEQQIIIDSIWDSGTHDVDERQWCLDNGWSVREFRLCWDSARAVIDAGFPIAVTTVEPDSAHLQAVIGYDEYRGTLLIRDPYEREEQEFLSSGFFASYAVTGPRALLIYPPAKSALLHDIELPECEEYDAYFDMQKALKVHQRASSVEILEQIEQQWPGKRQSLLARRRLGYYDGDAAYILACLDSLLALYPEDAGLQLRKQEMLYHLGYVHERKQFLDEVYSTGKLHNAVVLAYLEVLQQDNRQQPQSYLIIKSLLSHRPTDPRVYYRFALLRWAQREYEEALELYAIAAMLAQPDDFYALKYFHAAKFLHREDEVLSWMRRTVEQETNKSTQAAITLFKALDEVDREQEGFEYLLKTLVRLPEDSDVAIFLADKYIETGQLDEASGLLEKILGRVREIDWLLSYADLCEQKQNYSEALDIRRQLVSLQPLNDNYQRRYSELLGQLEGYEKKVDYLKALVKQSPDNFDFYEMLFDAMGQESFEEKEALIRALLKINPTYAWAQRELAIVLGKQLKLPEAFEAMVVAEALDPNNPSLFATRAQLHVKNGDSGQAKRDLRSTLRLSIDATYAYGPLLDLCIDIDTKREALAFIRAELIQQVSNGDAILRYAEIAAEILPAEEVWVQLQEALESREDLWESWSVMMHHCQDMQRYEEAENFASQALDKFPLLPRLWLERARNFRLQSKYTEERIYLQKALEINPNYSTAIRYLSENMEHQGDYESSLNLLRQAARHQQMDPVIRGYLADIQWRLGLEEEAMEELSAAIRLDPEYSWAWSSFKSWSEKLGRETEAESLAAEILLKQPGDSRAWLNAALLSQDTRRAFECVQRAVDLSPGSVEYRKAQIKLYVNADAYQEAIDAYQACGDLREHVELKSFYPWILRCMGKLEEAIQLMHAMQKEYPDYADGWRLLSRWATANKDHVLALKAAREYAKYEAHEVEALTNYADALLQLDKFEQAMEQFEKALALEPADVDANLNLFDLYLEQKQFARAETLISQMAVHLDDKKNPYVEARLGQLYALQGRKQEAFSQLQTLAQEHTNNTWLLSSIIEQMNAQGWEDEVNSCIDTWIEKIEDYGSNLARTWVKRKADDKEWFVGKESFRHLMNSGEGGVYIVDGYLDHLVDTEQYERFIDYVASSESLLKGHNQTWSSVGYHYSDLGLHDEAVDWMADWRSRDVQQTWALRALALSYRHQHHWKKCYQVCRYGLGLEDETGQNSMRVWIALEYAIRGERMQLNNHLPMINREDLSASEEFSYQMIEIIEYFHDHHHDADIEEQLTSRLSRAKEKYPHYLDDGTSRRLHRRVCYELASGMAGWPKRWLLFFRFYASTEASL